MEKKRLEAERMKLRIDLAKIQKKVAEAQMIAKFSEVKLAEFELTRRQVTAPTTGFIESRIVQLGQWVQPGSPIATVIQMDKLRVEGDIDALRYREPILKGTPVKVLIYTHSDEQEGVSFASERDRSKALPRDAKLGFVSMEIDLNNRRRVWVELENEKVGDDWLIKPGMRAEIIIPKSGQVF
jgi:multidrug resistance efflux pump